MVAVSYTNTIPFIYGLTHTPGIAEHIDLRLMPPAACAEAWLAGEADVALVPLGAMDGQDLRDVCCHWCLGAEGPVESVLLLSDSPLSEISTLYLDKESRTSVLMTSMLCKFHWKINPALLPLDDTSAFHPAGGEAALLIGDKTFRLPRAYRYTTDIAESWQQMTGLPAVFACWLTRRDVPDETRQSINEALAWGVSHTEEAVRDAQNLILTPAEAIRYLTQCISFRLGTRQYEAIQRFFDYRDRL